MAHTTLPPRLTNTTVSVKTFTGQGAYGPVHAAAADVDVAIADSRRLVRNAKGGEVVSETTLYANPDQHAALAPESLVTLPDREATVILAKLHRDLRGRPAMVEAAVT